MMPVVYWYEDFMSKLLAAFSVSTAADIQSNTVPDEAALDRWYENTKAVGKFNSYGADVAQNDRIFRLYGILKPASRLAGVRATLQKQLSKVIGKASRRLARSPKNTSRIWSRLSSAENSFRRHTVLTPRLLIKLHTSGRRRSLPAAPYSWNLHKYHILSLT